MKNLEIAQIFYQMAEYIEMEEVSFRSRAYSKAARVLESLELDIAGIYEKEGTMGLKSLSGVGQAIADKIEEYLKTGKIKAFDKLKKTMPS